MAEFVKNGLMNEIAKVLEYYDTKILNLETEINSLKKNCVELYAKNELIKEELESFSKVSIIKSLNNTLNEKDGTIKYLESQVKLINKKLNSMIVKTKVPEPVEAPVSPEPVEKASIPDPVEAPVSPEPVEKAIIPEPVEGPVSPEPVEASDEEEVEVDFIEKILRKKTYYITDDADREIYEKLPDGDVGELVGKYNDKGRPVFFKKTK